MLSTCQPFASRNVTTWRTPVDPAHQQPRRAPPHGDDGDGDPEGVAAAFDGEAGQRRRAARPWRTRPGRAGRRPCVSPRSRAGEPTRARASRRWPGPRPAGRRGRRSSRPSRTAASSGQPGARRRSSCQPRPGRRRRTRSASSWVQRPASVPLRRPMSRRRWPTTSMAAPAERRVLDLVVAVGEAGRGRDLVVARGCRPWRTRGGPSPTAAPPPPR